jgi:hypothetical protein
MTPDEQWLGDLDAMVELSLAANEERCRLMIEDIEALPTAPIAIAEGTPLVPWLIEDRMAGRDHAVWLIPSEEFQAARLEERPRTTWDLTSDPARALESRIQRELRVSHLIEEGATVRGFHVLQVDETTDLAATMAAVEKLFAAHIAAGPRAERSDERRALRRDGNLLLLRQVSTYFERVPGAGDPRSSPIHFACECGRSGCEAAVASSLVGARRVFEGDGSLLSPGHGALEEGVTAELDRGHAHQRGPDQDQ